MLNALLLVSVLAGLAQVPALEMPAGLVVGQRFGDGRGIVVVSVVDTGSQSWYTLPTSFGADQAIPGVRATLDVVEEVLASPDGRWLAVASSGSGHLAIEVVDLELLFAGRGWLRLAWVGPFPARVRIAGWQVGELRLASDRSLEDCGEDCTNVARGEQADDTVYLLDPAAGVIRSAGGPAGPVIASLLPED